MTFWVAGAVVVSGALSSNAASKAGQAQAGAAREAAQLQNEQYYQTREDQMPWLKAGERALGKLEGAVDYTPFGMNQFNADPGYAFRLAEGQKALERSAAARGGLMSGGTGKALTRYGQEMGSQEYMNAFNRYQTERAAKLQPLQSLAGVGQTTATTLGQAGQTTASNVGEALTSGAAARASGYVGQANALNQGLGTYLNYSQGQNMVNAMRQNQYGPNYGQYTPGSNTFVGPMPE